MNDVQVQVEIDELVQIVDRTHARLSVKTLNLADLKKSKQETQVIEFEKEDGQNAIKSEIELVKEEELFDENRKR